MVIDYDRTAAEYEASLVTKLRGHGAGSFLENWVPDPDPALSIFNMIEAAWTAGREELSLRVARATLANGTLNKLQEIAGMIAEFQAAESGNGYVLMARRIARLGGRAPTASASAKAVRKTKIGPADANGQTGEVPWDIHPLLERALEGEVLSFRREGAPNDGEAVTQWVPDQGAVMLTVDPEGEFIRSATHIGVEPLVRRRLVELMCREVEGKTVQDASDHAGTYAVQRLRLRAGGRPTQGILLASNAGREVIRALRLIREACQAYRARHPKSGTENFFEVPPRADWRTLTAEERLARVVGETQRFWRGGMTGEPALKAVRIDNDIHGHACRVIVQVGGQLPRDTVPTTLRGLERHLKATVEPALQVYLEPLKDKNVIRRL